MVKFLFSGMLAVTVMAVGKVRLKIIVSPAVAATTVSYSEPAPLGAVLVTVSTDAWAAAPQKIKAKKSGPILRNMENPSEQN
jgi:hypothetical protein